MYKVLALATLLFAHTSVHAISNIESQRPGPPPEGWSGHLEFSASGQSGDVEEDRYGIGGKVVFKAEENTAFMILEKARGETQDIKTSDEAFAHLRGIHERTDRFAVEAFLQWQENEFSNLLSRNLLGAGGRFGILADPDHYTFDLGLGAFREWEETDLGTYVDNQTNWRVNTYWAYRHRLNEQVNWYNTVYYQPKADDFDDYRMLFDAGLTVRLTDALQLQISYNLRYDSRPPQNLEVTPVIDRARTNTQYSTSFLYEF